jgi:hypothetical protein
MQGRRSALAAGVVVALLAGAPMVAFAQPRAVVELFTSQGCSSCPAADKLLSDFTADGSIVALSLPIDYWDYLGWRDTLARPRHTARQRNYSAVRGDRQVYTPQVVVNGSAQALGSDRSAIEAAITNTQHGKRLPVMVAVTPNGSGLDVAVSENAAAPAGEVWLCGIAKAIKVAIGRGENRGHTFTYHNVVRPPRPGTSRAATSRAIRSTRWLSWCKAVRRRGQGRCSAPPLRRCRKSRSQANSAARHCVGRSARQQIFTIGEEGAPPARHKKRADTVGPCLRCKTCAGDGPDPSEPRGAWGAEESGARKAGP